MTMVMLGLTLTVFWIRIRIMGGLLDLDPGDTKNA